MTNQEKKQHKVGFILHSINEQGCLPSYHTLRVVLGRFEDIIKELIDNKTIQVIKEAKPYQTKNQITGKTIQFYTKRLYRILDKSYNYVSFENNFYTKKLNNVKSKLRKEDKCINWLLDTIENTLEKTTLNGEKVSTDVIYTKGRFYSDYTQFKKEDRLALKIDGQSVSSIDIKSSTIQLLIKSGVVKDEKLLNEVKNPEFWQDMANEFNMDKGDFKVRFISFVNGNYFDKELYLRFKPFFSKIMALKDEYGYKFISKLYTKLEKDLMFEIYENCTLNKIDFLPMHDEIIVKKSDKNYILDLFKSYNIDVKVEEVTTSTEAGQKTKYNALEGYRKVMTEKALKSEESKNRLMELLANAPSLS